MNEHTLNQLRSLRLDGMVRALEDQAVSTAASALGFDERFVRLWQFYLAYCEAGFRARSTDVHQYVLAHAEQS